jgi:hypothetical protein
MPTHRVSMTDSTTTRARLAAAWALVLALGLPAMADARRPAIEGRLPASYTVVALATDGRARTIENVRGSFELVPPARTVTLHLLGSTGRYLGPVVVAGKGSRVVVQVRAGARLGTLRVLDDYARPRRKISARRLGGGRRAKARAGVPIGAGVLGRVRSGAVGPTGSGRDRDLDGIPGRFDVDDDGDLVLDVRERATARRVASGAVPAAELEILAGVLALASLAWQAARTIRRRRSIEVEARLGLPVYSQGAGRWAVFIEVFNRTDHQMRWVSAALETKDGRIFYLMEHPPGGELPAVIEPHDSHHTWVDCHELERQGLPLDEPVIATAKLATGEIHRSPAKRTTRRSRFGS